MGIKKILFCTIAIILELFSLFSLPFLVLIFGLLSIIVPYQPLKKWLKQKVESVALLWADLNHFILGYLLGVRIDIIGAENITPGKNYLELANHQSWVDILMLEEALRNRTGFSRYFIKKNLMHVPLAGWACHLLHYPYMYRFTKEHLAKHPEDKGKDVAITKRACQKLRGIHFKLNNFPEGTRFTPKKHFLQQSPYQHLLKPKCAGIVYALQILNDQLNALIDLTIIYHEKPNVIKLFLGKLTRVTIYVERLPITPDLIGDYENDKEFRVYFQRYINNLWEKKDKLISSFDRHP
jgi:1-acyl-sn-glycerol-3-phosphate acyltransferase